jgi:hypothetical protein
MNTLEKLQDVKEYISTLMNGSEAEAIDLLVNHGELMEETLAEVITELFDETPRSNNP